MPIQWNDQADAKLLLAVISTSNAKLNYSAIAQYMGPGKSRPYLDEKTRIKLDQFIANSFPSRFLLLECTVSSVQHRIQRLREKVKAYTAAGNDATEHNGTPTSSPEKKRGRAKKVSVTAEDENAKPPGATAEIESPTKKVKST
ncbi:uncharacterized protein BJX67DRAFT_35367 [Aspergillus lucknowensis]|uniref:Uncharacterized protein n=1 Tax=Aspergillus lucknowensis TaxID=176173 RepID=A0ABR4LZC6_9EURO